ncbi:SDR family oxidoreductase [Nitrospina watsonii]|uniref:NAD(P)-bd_dom domain-containing protein n=1 Tax=Nitrospina watsonii TaxID=1323948 RepID=A0ABM9HEU0_9BACT|nr:NAD(P)H-binding protein [Nitrospina watsonii]CAI2718745.1 NAD(P)-bd_dom domain-containing protein [Nitrospina watsonii]
MVSNLLIIGGTGMLGHPVARKFQKEGCAVRVLTRNLDRAREVLGDGFDLRQGDVEDPASLDRALAGCDGVHINLQGGNSDRQLEAIEYRGTLNILGAAEKAGVQRLSTISYAVDLENHPHVPYASVKHRTETAVAKSPIPHTIFRGSQFMESLPLYFRDHTPCLIGKQPHHYHWVAADDYAHMVFNAYQLKETVGRQFDIFGPEAMTMEEALLRYCAAMHGKQEITRIPIWAMKLMGYLMFDRRIRFVAELMEFFSRAGEHGNPIEANRLLGAPTTTLEQWCEQRKAERRGDLPEEA